MTSTFIPYSNELQMLLCEMYHIRDEVAKTRNSVEKIVKLQSIDKPLQDNVNDVLGTKEALNFLFEDKIAYGEFLSMVRAGKIPAQKAGNKYLFSKKALNQLKTVMFSTNKHGHSIKQA